MNNLDLMSNIYIYIVNNSKKWFPELIRVDTSKIKVIVNFHTKIMRYLQIS